jgi:probable rRNA maturation factor
MLEIATLTGEGWSDDTDWQGLAERAAHAALGQTPYGALADIPAAIEIAIKLSDDAEVRQLNAQWRGKDKPTNILSFPMIQPDLLEAVIDAQGNADDGETQLGDMILARETCVREAEEKAIPLPDHVTHLIIHGVLHLVGHDHMDDEEAGHMEALEIRALETLGIADPYADRDASPAGAIDETGNEPRHV